MWGSNCIIFNVPFKSSHFICLWLYDSIQRCRYGLSLSNFHLLGMSILFKVIFNSNEWKMFYFVVRIIKDTCPIIGTSPFQKLFGFKEQMTDQLETDYIFFFLYRNIYAMLAQTVWNSLGISQLQFSCFNLRLAKSFWSMSAFCSFLVSLLCPNSNEEDSGILSLCNQLRILLLHRKW